MAGGAEEGVTRGGRGRRGQRDAHAGNTPESGPLRAGEAQPGPVSDGSSNRAVMASDMLGQKLKTWKSGILTSVGALDMQTIKVWSRAYSRHSPAPLACRECTVAVIPGPGSSWLLPIHSKHSVTHYFQLSLYFIFDLCQHYAATFGNRIFSTEC